jgi:diketogulonate reductase-like aldo/keto reductase
MASLLYWTMLRLLLTSPTSAFPRSLHSGALFSTTTAALASNTMNNLPTILLRDGTLHPAIGFGTYKVGFIPASASSSSTATATNASAEDCVLDALKSGYRFLECAEFYGNERQIGKAIQRSGIPRKELFLCSKVWTTTIEQGTVRQRLEQTLQDLQTDYVDLYLIHWPVPNHHVEAYKTLVQLKREGKCRGIGVSNYAWEDYLELKESGIASEDLPLVNQIEINPFLYRRNTIAQFTNDGVVLQSYRALRDGKAFNDPTVVAIATDVRKTPAQVLGRWCVQKGFVYVPKSVRQERMLENARVFDFELSGAQMEELDKLTTPEAIATFENLYRKCVNRDTSRDGTMDGVKMVITTD